MLRQHWVSIFQAPEAVLSDRGPAFRDSEFEEYVLKTLRVSCIYQRLLPARKWNQRVVASRSGSVDCSTARTLEVPFDEVLRDAVAVHNATLHSSLGDSPFFTMFAFDATLPGWQRYRPDRDEMCRSATRREIRHRAMIRAQLLGERMKLEEKEDVAVGNVVVYIFSEYERKYDRPPASTSDSYTPKWSLPSRVVEVNSRTIICQPFGCPNHHRQMPRSQIKVLRGEVPQSLVRLNLTQIERLNPRYPKVLMLGSKKPEGAGTWQQLEDGDQSRRLKRTRPGINVPGMWKSRGASLRIWTKR